MEFRLANAADTTDIADLIHQTWGTSTNEDLIASILARPEQPVWVVTNGTSLAGFCASFMTHAADDTPRWEIDLLAVAPEARGQGLGRTLVSRSMQSGRQRGAALYRALIAMRNTASERCFEVNGFQTASICNLWVGQPAAHIASLIPDGAHLIPVETLTYRGVWVEDRYDTPAFEAAQQLALKEGRDTVGAVIPEGAAHDAAELQFTHIDRYHWWVLSV